MRVPTSQPALRHLFSIIVAIAFFPILQMTSGFFHLLASTLVTYFVANFYKGKRMPWVVFVYVASFTAGNRFFIFFFFFFQNRNGSPDSEVSTNASWSILKFISFFESQVIRAVYGLTCDSIEITGPHMVLTMKLTTFAWNVYDGRRKLQVRLPPLFFWKRAWLYIFLRTWINGKPQRELQNTRPYLNSSDMRQSYFSFPCSFT